MATQSNKLNIKIHVDRQDYHFAVRPEEELAYRQAAKLINETINRQAEADKGKDRDEYLRRAALVIAVDLCRNYERNDTEPIIKRLRDLNADMEKTINEPQEQRKH
ncbi:MAG: cell division protein ZapA [Bacteroidaceae bacterium]|nr:cell division protein ZapA [Bacteroidaceae bacterium]